MNKDEQHKLNLRNAHGIDHEFNRHFDAYDKNQCIEDGHAISPDKAWKISPAKAYEYAVQHTKDADSDKRERFLTAIEKYKPNGMHAE